jgi:Domain of unknown function (DUF4124)
VQIPSARLAILLVLAAAPWSTARADIYRCTVPDGRTLYSDGPCPRGALHSSNITAAVGACSTAECIAQREQAAGEARERLRAERELLAEFADRRRRDEIDSAKERVRLDELLWRQSVEARLTAVASEAGYAPAYPVYYPIYPAYGVVRPCGWRCLGSHPRPHNAVSAKRSWGTAIRMDRR